MTSRATVVRTALQYNETLNGRGYDCANPFSADLGRPAEAWCGDFATDIYKRAGLPLPSMQPGCRTGFAYVPDAWEAAGARGARRRSWQAQPGDLVIFHWPGGNPEGDHVEVATAYAAQTTLYTIGGNSGPSNVDGFAGHGGVHRHGWNAPAGHGNPDVLGVIDMAAFVQFGADHRLLMLKSPLMTGSDVRQVQAALNKADHAGLAEDGAYGRLTRGAVIAFETAHHLRGDGIVGAQVRRLLNLPE